MTLREVIGELLEGMCKGLLILIVLFVVLGLLLKGCMAIVDAHDPIDVRINENDRTITGLNYPGDTDVLLQTYLYLDIYSEATPPQDTTPISQWDIELYTACQNRNRLRREHLMYNLQVIQKHPLREAELIESNAELQTETEVCTL